VSRPKHCSPKSAPWVWKNNEQREFRILANVSF
jgi:hypothetical protein